MIRLREMLDKTSTVYYDSKKKLPKSYSSLVSQFNIWREKGSGNIVYSELSRFRNVAQPIRSPL